ncbi:sugar ABC transporter ATP-binding protein [Bradyrhizobium sacchari]|nr:sugar ABC transporter ATP-binding protein [Bradyrhizobium sacchari]OPY97034.1 sugar ABC transporter ATP-binding protein [Bradyrhizobium sacchari]
MAVRPGRDQGTAEPLLRLIDISKSFPGVHALRGVSLEIHAGEVHVILGQNGAGKSSLIKVLCGAYLADDGVIEHKGRRIAIQGPADANGIGVGVIFQEFSLAPYLDIAQNIFLGRERAFAKAGIIDKAAMHAAARDVLAQLGLNYDTWTFAADLGVAQQQMVEIAKALSQNSSILVMDEPTAAISERESERLFEVIARLKQRGVAIVYISHRMREVVALGDRITVMRDGAVVASYRRDEVSPDEMVGAMIGRSLAGLKRREALAAGAPVLTVTNLQTAKLTDISLEIRAGEVVGLAGLVGSGRTEVVRAIFGADPLRTGVIRLDGADFAQRPDRSTRAGLALLPEDRKREGLALPLAVGENATAAALWRLFRRGWFAPSVAEKVCRNLITRLNIATPGPAQFVRNLSGGNQQKVVLGKWLAAGSRLFMLDEPTRGVDIGAKTEIYRLIDDLAKDGAAVLVISSELPELIHLCDRAYVMRDYRIVGHLGRNELSEKAILDLAVHQ